MLKRKILAAVLPVVAAGTVVGSGFSAWYFGTASTTTKTVTINTSTDNGYEAQLGTIKVSYGLETNTEIELSPDESGVFNAPITLVLDQGGYKNKSNTNAGISFKQNETNTKVQYLSFSYDISDDALLKFESAGYDVDITLKVTLGANLKNYVEFQTASENVLSNSVSNVAFDFSEGGDGSSIEYSTALTADSHDSSVKWMLYLATDNYLENDLLKYKDKPDNYADYGAMQTALSGANGNISFSASVAVTEK